MARAVEFPKMQAAARAHALGWSPREQFLAYLLAGYFHGE